MGVVWSIHIEILFVNSLAWFGQQNLRFIFLFVGIGAVLTTQFQIYFLSSLARNEFGGHMLRHLLFRRWHERVLVNTC